MTKTLRLGYNMRISRPGIWYLNPYVNNQNPTNIYYGNPNLDAEHTHNFNINFGSFTPKINLNTTLSYSLTNNAITSYSFVKDGVTHNTQDNIGKNQNVGLNVFGSWTPNLKIRWYVNANANYTDIRSTNETELKNNGFSGQVFSGLTLNLPKDLRLGANGGIFGNNIQLQTTQSSFFFYSFNVMKSLFNKKLDINLSTVNPFAASVKFTSTTKGEGFTQETTYLEPIRNVRLSATFRFGNLKTSIKKVQKSISNDDLKAGGSNSQRGTGDAGVSN
jgi:outer membrane receptor protein involved in Fe transport